MRDALFKFKEKFLNGLFKELMAMVDNVDPAYRIGGIVAMEYMTDIFVTQNMESKVLQFANTVRPVLEKSNDPETLRASAKALGNLTRVSTRAGGTTLIELVERSIICPSLKWLEEDSSKRFAAVLILKELAENNPTLFILHADAFFRHIWLAVHDSKEAVREGAADALRESLKLLQARDTKNRKEWYDRVWQEVEASLQNQVNIQRYKLRTSIRDMPTSLTPALFLLLFLPFPGVNVLCSIHPIHPMHTPHTPYYFRRWSTYTAPCSR
jgi:FKBP12-rapamycin complex-associated protein